MSEIKTGGSALPTYEVDTRDGMNLRDYFAAKALPACLATPPKDCTNHPFEQESFLAWSAQRAYRIADAMLEARSIHPATAPGPVA